MSYDRWLAAPYDDLDEAFECPRCDTVLDEPEKGCTCGWYPNEPDFEAMVGR